MPEKTLLAFGDHGHLSTTLPSCSGNSSCVLLEMSKSGIDIQELGATLQKEGAESFVSSWKDLMTIIESKSASLI